MFDTGKHGVGGRMASRASGEASLRAGTGALDKPIIPVGGLRWAAGGRAGRSGGARASARHGWLLAAGCCKAPGLFGGVGACMA